jgi:hypothetical protein
VGLVFVKQWEGFLLAMISRFWYWLTQLLTLLLPPLLEHVSHVISWITPFYILFIISLQSLSWHLWTIHKFFIFPCNITFVHPYQPVVHYVNMTVCVCVHVHTHTHTHTCFCIIFYHIKMFSGTAHIDILSAWTLPAIGLFWHLSTSGTTVELMVKVKVQVVPVLNWAPRHEGILGEWMYSSFFDLGTRCGWVVSFTPQLLYPQGKSPWYPLGRRLGGPQSCSGCSGEEKNSQSPCQELNPRTLIVQPVVQYYTNWAIMALAVELIQTI